MIKYPLTSTQVSLFWTFLIQIQVMFYQLYLFCCVSLVRFNPPAITTTSLKYVWFSVTLHACLCFADSVTMLALTQTQSGPCPITLNCAPHSLPRSPFPQKTQGVVSQLCLELAISRFMSLSGTTAPLLGPEDSTEISMKTQCWCWESKAQVVGLSSCPTGHTVGV